MKRVVISGIGSVAPLGVDVPSLIEKIELAQSAVRYMEGWDVYSGLNSLVAAPAELRNEKDIPRKNRRSMGRMGIFAVQASQQAVMDAGLSEDTVSSGRTGCIIGSTMGGAEAMNDTFELMLPEKDLSKLSSMNFFKCVSHTAAMNVAQYLGIKGYVMATSAACASALQAIGTGYGLIQAGKQDVVLCGGAEELHPIITGSFDILYATSTHFNDNPDKTPRPFDKDRDGLVCGEGSGIVVLEDYEHAKKRNAKIYAEVIGYHTCGSGAHVSQSNREAMSYCMTETLKSAQINADEVDYINAHATATQHGDQEESESIKKVFGSKVPVSSLKGHLGHTLGASGAIELIVSLLMMKNNKIYPTRNLDNISEDCQGINYVVSLMDRKIDVILKNCFAFGGINVSLLCKKICN
ncbi:3-oxoacyl-[acyl-carrier-protein] synthase, KASII [hydrothermal vent metagenome]|uniref:3-oxoacyl-[acyl-carrier-protein] synthase, KASII n=1 Tax=hydrothermal vent metagenome TaxID=652676 RepID=A0A3B1DJ44_9ZZZZ